MGKYIYINYAYEDQEQVMMIIRRLQGTGINIYYGNGSEERVAGSTCVVHFCTAASHTSRSYRKIMNFTLKHELDSMIFHLGEHTIASDIEMQLDVLHTLFKYKYRQKDAETEPAEEEQSMEQDRTADAGAVKAEKEEAARIIEAMEPIEQAVVIEAAKPAEQTVTAEAALSQEAEKKPVVAEQKAVKPVPVERGAEPERALTKEELFQQGRRWLTGDGCDVDIDKAFMCFRQAASQGHVEAQYQLSVCYDKGIGVRRSISEAAKWCQMAAYGGHAQAQSEIGYCYEYGQGVVRNIKEAVRWYEIASEQGNIEAKNNLAFCYQKGKGVAKNVQKAIQLYQEAADAGHASAQYNLGFCYWYGEGIKADKPKAIELFRQSADNGNAKASQMLKILNQNAYVR